MNPYLATKANIPEGYGHELFSLTHILTLLFTAALIYAVSRVYRRVDEKSRITIKRVIAFLLIADEILKDGNALLTGQWEWEFLPLHLCSISVFIVIIHSLTSSRILAEYLYAITLPTASMAMAFPDWTGALPFVNLMCFHSFSIHLLLVLYPALLLWGGFRPSWRYLRVIIPIVFMMAFIMHFLNMALGTNFFFVNGGGDGNPLTFLEDRIGWWYLLALPAIAAICWLPMYIIPARKARG